MPCAIKTRDNRPDEPVPELDVKSVRPRDQERLDPVDGLSHAPFFLPQWLNLTWQAACLQVFPGGEA